MDERIGFGLYQSCRNMGSVGRVSVFWLRWSRWGVGAKLDLYYLAVLPVHYLYQQLFFLGVAIPFLYSSEKVYTSVTSPDTSVCCTECLGLLDMVP